MAGLHNRHSQEAQPLFTASYMKNLVQGGALLLAYLAFVREYYFKLELTSYMTYVYTLAVQDLHIATVRSL